MSLKSIILPGNSFSVRLVSDMYTNDYGFAITDVTAISESENEEYRTTPLAAGICGDGLAWELSQDGIMTITGEGEMADYGENGTGTPWYDFRDTVNEIRIAEGVTGIGMNAFNGCCNLSEATIPETVSSIGNAAFTMCVNLTGITIPDSVESIGNAAFTNCGNLVSLTIPDSVTRIGDWTFAACSRLAVMTIPDGVTDIGEYAFAYCYSLTIITIPGSITRIGRDAFCDCINLKIVEYTGSIRKFANILIETGNDSLTGASIRYIVRSDRTLVLPASLTMIECEAFKNLPHVDAISVSDKVTGIAEDAFDEDVILIAPAGS